MIPDIEAWDEPQGHIRIFYDEDGTSPREDSCIGTMACTHPSYRLGDEDISKVEFVLPCTNCAGEGETSFDITCSDCHGQGTVPTDPETYFKQERGARVVMPLWLMDHSGLSISCGGSFEGGSRDWDTSRIGAIFDTPQGVAECMGDNVTDAEIKAALEAEVELYGQYLGNEIYGYEVTTRDGRQNSCVGFLGDLSYVKQEARDALASLVQFPAPRTLP